MKKFLKYTLLFLLVGVVPLVIIYLLIENRHKFTKFE